MLARQKYLFLAKNEKSALIVRLPGCYGCIAGINIKGGEARRKVFFMSSISDGAFWRNVTMCVSIAARRARSAGQSKCRIVLRSFKWRRKPFLLLCNKKWRQTQDSRDCENNPVFLCLQKRTKFPAGVVRQREAMCGFVLTTL